MLSILLVAWPFLIAFISCLLFMPLTIRLAYRFGLVDNPNKRPHPAHVQQRIVPRPGGLPIFISLLITSALFLPIDKHLLGILLACLILLVTGLLDDKLAVFNPYWRIVLQIVAAGIVVGSGIGVSFIANPFGGIIHLDQIVIPIDLFGPHRIILIADFLAFIWIISLMNIVNWSKGVDGQMPGIMLVAFLTIGFLSLGLYDQGDPNQIDVATLSFIAAGASAGLLAFNWYPSRIFPGFSAATILGLLLAVLSILSGAKLATALLVILIPAIDFIYTVFRRILSGHSPVWGDRGHLHHKLLELGLSHRQISLFYILSCATLGTIAALLHQTSEKIIIGVGLAVIFLGGIAWLHLLTSNKASSGKS